MRDTCFCMQISLIIKIHLKNCIWRCVINHTQDKYVFILINSEQKPESFWRGKYKGHESWQKLAWLVNYWSNNTHKYNNLLLFPIAAFLYFPVALHIPDELFSSLGTSSPLRFPIGNPATPFPILFPTCNYIQWLFIKVLVFTAVN